MARSNFALDLKKFSSKVDDRANKIVRKIIIDIGTSVVMRSPVGDPDLWEHSAPKGYIGGRFRANGQYGNFSGGGIPTAQLNAVDPGGAATIEKIAAAIPAKPAGMVHVLINPLPYAMALEGGWSTQAPAGMVGLAVVEFKGVVEKAAAAV